MVESGSKRSNVPLCGGWAIRSSILMLESFFSYELIKVITYKLFFASGLDPASRRSGTFDYK